MEAFERAAQWAPDDGLVVGHLAWELAISEDPTIRDPARAVVLARRAVKLAPDREMLWITLGTACYRAGRWGEAVTALEKGLALAPTRTTLGNDKAATWFFLAMAYCRLGQDQKARWWFEKAAQWMDENLPQDAGLRRLRPEAAELLRIQVSPVVPSKSVMNPPERPGPPDPEFPD
jgi:tetratricopeptide (TPR) repeat protein